MTPEQKAADAIWRAAEKAATALWVGGAPSIQEIADKIFEAVADEREACARLAEGLQYRMPGDAVRPQDPGETGKRIARVIRRRGIS